MNTKTHTAITTTTTTTLCPDHGIVNPKKAKTHTATTDGYPEAGPFETESEAMGAFVPAVALVLSVELREDGWYRTYVVNSTTSTIWYGLGPKTKKPRRLDAKCWEFARNIFHGRKAQEG